MNDTHLSIKARLAFAALNQRCVELGLSAWQCDATGTIVSGKSDETLAQAAKLVAGQSELQIQPFNNGWLLPLEQKQGARRVGLHLVNLPGATEAEAKRLVQVLRWSVEDATQINQDSQTIDQFSEKLSQAYEETNLLYRMAKLLNTVSDPADAVQTVLTQLQQVVPFKWLAIRFAEQAYGVRELAGWTMITGEPPFPKHALESLTAPMFAARTSGKGKSILSPMRDPIATLCNAEVFSAAITHDDHVIGLLLAGNKQGPDSALSSFETQFLEATADFLGVFHENLARFAEQQEMSLGTLRALSTAIEAKDRYTGGHSERVGLMASRLAQKIGLDRHIIEQYRIAGIVHDVGKIGVPEAVLCKPGKLTDEEFAQIKLHPSIGYNILRDVPALSAVLPGVLSHHERWDGRGYPNKLAGEEIPLIARVLALADTFDAMSSNRSYRPALPRQRVLEEIARSAGTQFDPELAPHFVSLNFDEFDEALETHKQQDQIAA